jgi:TM2 domain-containing membrane protein YozV
MKEVKQIVINSLISIEGFLIGLGIMSVIWPSDNVNGYLIFGWAICYLILSLFALAVCWLIDKLKGNRNVNMYIGNNNVIANTSIEQDENGLHITVPKGTKVEVKEI